MAVERGKFERRMEELQEEVSELTQKWDKIVDGSKKKQLFEMPPQTKSEAVFRTCLILYELCNDPDLVHFLIQPSESYQSKYYEESVRSLFVGLLLRQNLDEEKGPDELLVNYEMHLCSHDYGFEVNFPDPIMTARIAADFLAQKGVDVEVDVADGASGDLKFRVSNGNEDYRVFAFLSRQSGKADVPFGVVIRPMTYFLAKNAPEN